MYTMITNIKKKIYVNNFINKKKMNGMKQN